MIFLLAILGGLLLNLMPCVLPVLALKAMSFNDDHRWYAAGIMSVFMGLATLSVAAGFAWGQQFNSQPFVIALTAITFVMGLSYLGVWEITIPGFRTGETSAFTKGVIATVMATPCSGPFLGPVFGATLGQHPLTVYAIFACVGLGMALPYLALPWIRLPKPGAWMVTVKQLAGFAMLGSSVWMLGAVADRWLFHTLWYLLALGFAAWLVGRFPRLFRVGIAIGLASGVIFQIAPRSDTPWLAYTPELFKSVQDRPVAVYFTADWCLTCKVNELVLHSSEVGNALSQSGTVPIRAEMNDESAVLLRSLGYNSVPVLAIFRPGKPPVVLPDLLTKQAVIEALR